GVPPTLSIPGLAGTFVSTIAPLISSSLVTQGLDPVAALLNKLIATQVANTLGLPSLPSGSSLAIREVRLEGDQLNVMPVLGAFGTILSDFQPSGLGVVSRLAGLQIQPTSIGTSDPTTRVAQGKVVLEGPAPAGGVTGRLSSDRPDWKSVTPAALLIVEGENSGAFTVTGIPQPVMTMTIIDVTVSASLGGQTMTAPVSVVPEAPTAGPVVVAGVFSAPVTGVPGVTSLDL